MTEKFVLSMQTVTFPAPFIDPNEEQRALISDYFEQVEEAGNGARGPGFGSFHAKNANRPNPTLGG